MGSIRRLDDKKYRIVYDVPSQNGKRKQKTETLTGVTKPEAEAIYADRKRVVATGQFHGTRELVGTLMDRFMDAKSQKLAASTLERYQGIIRTQLRPAFGHKRLSDLSVSDLLNAYHSWATTVSPRTLRHIHALMRSILGRGVKWGMIHRNVSELIDSDELPRVSIPESVALTAAELRTLLDKAATPSPQSLKRGYLSSSAAFYPLIAFAAFTGARRGECLAIRWTDIDFDNRRVRISRSLSEVRGQLAFKGTKSGKARNISLPQSVVSILRKHHASQAGEKLALGSGYQDQDLVFARPDGSPISPWSVTSAFRDLVARAGVPRIRLHDLRDTHASLLRDADVPIEVISKRLGHANVGITTERYLVVYPERDEEASHVFEQLVG